MFGLDKSDSDFLAGMLLMLAYIGAIMSFMSIGNITKFQLYIRMMGVIFLTGITFLTAAYLTAKGLI